MNRRLLLLAAAGFATGCAAPRPSQYAAERPVLDLRRYFDGTVDAWGIFTDRSGAVVKRFTVVLDCRWNGDEGVLDEDFTFSDGTKQRRIWRLRHEGDGRFTGRADDVVGEATGRQQGNAFQWRYTLTLPVDGRTWNVEMDAWMFLVDERTLLNRATMSKFGVRLGEVTLSFRRR
jgi:hypothetical protein